MLLEDLKIASAMLRQNAVKPLVVANEAEADLLTKKDPSGREWKMGDKYYRVECVGELKFAVDDN